MIRLAITGKDMRAWRVMMTTKKVMTRPSIAGEIGIDDSIQGSCTNTVIVLQTRQPVEMYKSTQQAMANQLQDHKAFHKVVLSI